MEHFVGLVGIAVLLFVSTNIDDMFVLLGFLVDPKFRARQVAIGQYLGIAALYGASVVGSLVSLVVPPPYIGLMGFVPLCLGLRKLRALGAGQDVEGDAEGHQGAPAGHGNIVAVAAVTIANGGDNISTYTPFFATRTMSEIAVMGLVFAGLTAIWIRAAFFLANHPTIGAPIRYHGHRMMPFLLVALGLIILYEAGSIGLLYRFLSLPT